MLEDLLELFRLEHAEEVDVRAGPTLLDQLLHPRTEAALLTPVVAPAANQGRARTCSGTSIPSAWQNVHRISPSVATILTKR